MDGEDEPWLHDFEQQCTHTIDNESTRNEQLLGSEGENYQKKMWTAFQDAATSVALLYKEGSQSASLWIPFQSAAGSVTLLYKESYDALRSIGELSSTNGYNRRNKEIISWAKRNRRFINKEDLLSYLTGKPVPPKPNNHWTLRDGHHHAHHHISHHRSSPRPRNISPPPNNPQPESFGADAFVTFRDAISRGSSNRRSRGVDLGAFISSEFSRNCNKRPASPSDVTMDSPTLPKRSRLNGEVVLDIQHMKMQQIDFI